MRNAILLHGMPDKDEYFNEKMPSESNCHWFPWLQKQLLMKGILTQTPEMPNPYKPNYEKWESVFKQYKIDKETILLGHSCGGGFLVRWLSENKATIDKLVLVAPWIDPDGKEAPRFFDFRLDPEVASRVNELHILISDDDDKDILKSVEILSEKFPTAEVHRFKNKGHFCYEDMGKSTQFPELLEVIN